MFISEDVKYVGVNDTTIDLFEGQYKVPDGISYNSYVILDEKTAVMDTVDINFSAIWLEKVKRSLATENRIIWWFSIWSLTIRQVLRSF